MIIRFGLTFLFLFSLRVQAEDRVLKSGQITYHVSYVTKNVEGTSKEVKGKVRCADATSSCEFLMAAAIQSFNSDNANRDSHMIETVHGITQPQAVMSGKIKRNGKQWVSLEESQVTLSGVAHSYGSILLNPTGENCWSGKFNLILSQHSIERPSLLGIAIKDQVPIEFKGCF